MSQVKVQKVPTLTDRTLPVFTEIDELAERIRKRAFELFAERKLGDGHDLDDWLTAERELFRPAAELVEHKGDFVLDVALAGFEPGDISLTAPRQRPVKKRTPRPSRHQY